MKKLIRLVPVVLLVIAGNTIFGQSWTHVATGTDDTKYFVQEKRFTNDYGYRSAWVKHYNASDRIDGRKYYNTREMQFWQIDPAGERFRMLQIVIYDADGTVIKDFGDIPSKWSNIIPGSIGEFIYEAINRPAYSDN